MCNNLQTLIWTTLGALPSMALQLSPSIFTVAMQQALGLYSLVEIVPLA